MPVALALVVLCGVLQTGNRYILTDTKVGNQAIVDTFGKNNAVVAVYKNTDDAYANEQQLAQALKAHTTADGTPVLASYTAYSNTVREPYDAQKAVQKLELSAADTELLFTMYNLYQDPTAVQLSFAEFVDLGNELVSTDADAKEFVDADTTKTLQTLQVIAGVMSGSQTADQLFTKLTTGVMQGTDVQKFSIQQLYILYFYGTGAMPVGSINGRVFAQYALTTDTTNAVVHANLTDENRNKLADMLTVDRYYTDAAPLTYPQAYKKLTALQKEIKSDMASSQLDEDKISGVYIKSAVRSGQPLTAEMRACELLDFVSGNMDTNTLLKEKMSEENR